MGDKIDYSRAVGRPVLDGQELQVKRSSWRYAEGLSYDVYLPDGTCLTEDESLDGYPSDEQLRALLDTYNERQTGHESEGAR